jgi:beta-N-acetylhexosaminidase
VPYSSQHENVHVGDYLILRIDEPTLSSEYREFLQERKPIGVHFGKDAFLHGEPYAVWHDHYRSLRESILKDTGRSMMIWALDHEGGRVHRIPEPLTNFPYPHNWEDNARKIGSMTSQELRSLGINLLFGPSLDINEDQPDHVIGPRSFGRTPAAVDQFSSQYIHALEEQGILCTIKHFPGHGATKEDSHFDLPVLEKNLEALLEHELIPFQHAINGGAHAIMLAHILFPQIDETRPSSLSPAIARKLLREKLHFHGVVFTDDLDMKAIADNYSPTEIASSVVECGINFIICNHSLEHASQIMNALQDHLREQSPEYRERLSAAQKQREYFLHSLQYPELFRLSPRVLQRHQTFAIQMHESFTTHVKEFTGA